MQSGHKEIQGISFRRERYYAQRRQIKLRRARLVVTRVVPGRHAAEIALVAAPINLGVAVQRFTPPARSRQANAIVRARYRREIQDDRELVRSIGGLAQKGKDAVLPIVAIQPVKSRVVVIRLPETRRPGVKAV